MQCRALFHVAFDLPKEDSMTSFNQLDRNMPILVVDDFSAMRRIVKNCLKQLGFENITEAEDGMIAWSKLQEQDFKLVISDWNMPNMMGLDLLQSLRAEERYKDLPFLIVTAEAQKEAVSEATESGISTYIVKPFTANMLQTKLEAIFNS